MRARINERLEHATRFPVTLIVAPAGFGKSVALRDFLESGTMDAVRYDVRREDGTLLAFVRQFVNVLANAAPSALAAFPAMQERFLAFEEPVRQLSDWFAEHLHGVSGTIVLDDLHYASTDPACIALIADLVERTSERLRWIIAARSDLGLPVATWVAYGRMDIPIGEDDLRFTTEEALAAADETHAQLDLQEVESLRQLTEGWPVALAIALRTRTHATDLRSAASGTREMVYRYLAEQIFAGLSLAQRAFALSTCVFFTFDADMVEALGATPDFLADLRAKTTFLNEIAPGSYRYHDLFREFLEMELRRSGEREWIAALCSGAQILERRGKVADALALYTRARATEHISRVVEGHGLALFERGEIEPLNAALDAIPERLRAGNAIVLGLRAMIEAGRGHFAAAEPLFVEAIAAAHDDELHLSLVHRYAIELVRRNRDTIPLLEQEAAKDGIPPQIQAPLLGTLATAYAASARANEARETIEEALHLGSSRLEERARARLFHQASYVYLRIGAFEEGRSYAASAAELAMSCNLYEVAARAYINLYSSIYDQDDDPVACLDALQKAEECARKGASTQARLIALVASYEIEVERGSDPQVEHFDRLLRESRALFPQGYQRSLLPAEAMRAGWAGKFREAYELLAEAAEGEEAPARLALRSAEIAVYALAAGLNEQGESAIAAAETALTGALRAAGRPTRRTIRTLLFLALAELLRGHTSRAHRFLTQAEEMTPPAMRRLRLLGQTLRVVYRVQLAQADAGELQSALARLHAEHFGGLARLLAALPIHGSQDERYSSLTPAEREILRLLSQGASTKDVAVKTGRSPHTVDTHVRSICRKLNCSGRREAVALALTSGWVHG